MEDLAEDMKKGELDYRCYYSDARNNEIVSPLGQILGPKGLMPNPKSETVTKDVSNAVKMLKQDKLGINQISRV